MAALNKVRTSFMTLKLDSFRFLVFDDTYTVTAASKPETGTACEPRAFARVSNAALRCCHLVEPSPSPPDTSPHTVPPRASPSNASASSGDRAMFSSSSVSVAGAALVLPFGPAPPPAPPPLLVVCGRDGAFASGFADRVRVVAGRLKRAGGCFFGGVGSANASLTSTSADGGKEAFCSTALVDSFFSGESFFSGLL
eukprot:scaffold256_cov261-Pinguiococcus_pyrenoidosus.AAC.5